MKETELSVTIPGGDALHFSGELPAKLKAFHLEGSEVFGAEDWFGILLKQLVEFSHYTLFYTVMDCRQDVSFRRLYRGMTLNVHIALQNTMRRQYKGLGNITIRENECNMLHLPDLDVTGSFKAGSLYRTLDINVSLEAFTDMHYHVPLLNPFLEKTRLGQPAKVTPVQVTLTKDLAKIADDIVRVAYTDNLLRLSANHIVQRLLLLLLREATLRSDNPAYVPAETHAMTLVQMSLAKSYKKFPRTETIARELSLNATKLRQDFISAFNMSFWDYWYQQRMELSGRMLKDGKEVKEVVSEVGFSSINTFTRAFRNYFKMPPDKWRKQRE